MNNLFGKNTKDSNPFSDTFPDPLCNVNLKETCEFVKSFPLSSNVNNNNNNNTDSSSRTLVEVSVSAQRRREQQGRNSIITHRKLEPSSPSTPGRPVFSFTTSTTTNTSNVVGGNLPRKSFPSKWDDAEKWLMSTSNFKHCDNFKQQQHQMEKTQERVSKAVSNFPAFKGIPSCLTDAVLKDKFTDSIESIFPNFRYSEATKEGFLFRNQQGEKDACTEVVIHKDVGTEMSPLGSFTTSRCNTPFKSPSSSPARHNTPASRSGPLSLSSSNHNNNNNNNNNNNASCTINLIRLEECHFAKLKLGTEYDSSVISHNWSTREDEEEEISKSLRHNADSECKTTATWEEEEKTKCCLRYQREEAKIQAWVDLERAKAEAQSRKLEVKIQKMRSNLEEKLMKSMAVVHRKAEDLRAEAREQHFDQIQKATEQAQKIIMKQQYNTIVSCHNSSCGCFH